MRAKIISFAVHFLTASGIVCGFMALLAALQAQWVETFSWLGVALILDAIDGPLSRWVAVKTHLPRFSGERLDLIVDYFNYVAVPAFIVLRSPLLPEPLRFTGAAMILMTSLYHFADRNSKSGDGYFIGFPAIWNIVVFYLIVFAATPLMATALLFLFALLTFVPLHWMHPVRARKPRLLNIAIALAWFAAAAATLLGDLKPGALTQAVLIAVVVYVIALSLMRSLIGPKFSDHLTGKQTGD